MMYDVFISHASEDKDTFVRSLAHALRDYGLSVWYDEFALAPADSLRESIDKGLRSSRFGIVVISEAFIKKKWTKLELNALVSLEGTRKRVVVPIWYNVSEQKVRRFSPILADRFAIQGDLPIPSIVEKIVAVVRPETLKISAGSRRPGTCSRYVYANDFSTIKKALAYVNDCLVRGPSQSAAGPFFYVVGDCDLINGLNEIPGVYAYDRPHHVLPERRYIYINNTDSARKVEAIIGPFSEQANWEATKLGIYVEADLLSADVDRLRDIEAVTIYSEPQHQLDEGDRRVHEMMGWSKRGMATRANAPMDVDDFGAAIALEFQNICLVDLVFESIEKTVYQNFVHFTIYTSHSPDVAPIHGSFTGNLKTIVDAMIPMVRQDLNAEASQILSNVEPILCDDGVVIYVEYSIAPK